LNLTLVSVLALAAALVLGAFGHRAGGSFFEGLRLATAPAGSLFVNALQMIVIPVILTQLLAAMVSADRHPRLGRLGLRALALFVALLLLGALFALAVAPAALAFVPVDAAAIRAIQAATVVPDAVRAAAPAAPPGAWIANLLPANVFEAAARGEILPLMLFTILVGAAVDRLPEVRRAPLAGLIHGLAAALLTAVHWVLWLTPLGIFALAYGFALGTGLRAAGLIGAFIGVVSIPMLVFTLLLYPLAAVFGRAGLGDFARAAAPAQVVAAGTRSSLAALPALVEGGRRHLGLPAAATGFLLPLSVSTFKVNRTISAVLKVLFLAHVFGLTIGPARMAVFIATVVILSFTALGVPGGGGAFKTLPAYLAAGVPVEGIVILEAADAIPDIFKTLLNVTGDLAAATILTRGARSAPAVEGPGAEGIEEAAG
jgi:Na+/H+-dicarboxylate symporter